MDPGLSITKRKFRRNVKTIIYFCKKEKLNLRGTTLNLHKYIIKEDLRLKFLDIQYRLKLCSVIYSNIVKDKFSTYKT